MSLSEIVRLIRKILIDKGLFILFILGASFVLYRLGSFIINRFVRLKAKEEAEPTAQLIASRKRVYTLGTLIRNILKYFIFFVAGYLILEELIGRGRLLPVLAGAGIIGLAIGFGAQSLVRDVVAGFSILFEGQYAVGDVVHLKAGPYEAFGIVEEFGLRITKVKDFNGNLHYVPNGSVVGVDRYSQGYLSFNLDFTLPLQVPEERITKALKALGDDFQREHLFLLSAPKVINVFSTFNRTLVRVRVQVIPFQEETVKRCGQILADLFKESLGLVESPSPIVYQVSEEALAKYKESVFLR